MVGMGCLGGGTSDHQRETDSGIERLSSAGGRPGGSAPPPGQNLPVLRRTANSVVDSDPKESKRDPIY